MFDWNKIPRPELIKYWQLRKHEIEFQLDDLKVYQNMMEEQIERETKKFEEEISKNPKKYNPDSKYGIINQMTNSIPSLFRGSFLTQILSLVENQLRTICYLVEEYNYQNFSINDLRGSNDLEKSKIYLKKTIELDYESLNPEWGLILNCYNLRNAILHHQRQVEKDSKGSKFIFSHGSLEIIGGTQLMKQNKTYYDFTIEDRKLNDQLLESSSIFFEKLFDYIFVINKVDK